MTARQVFRDVSDGPGLQAALRRRQVHCGPGPDFTGRDPIEEFARTTCYGAFESFVGVAFEVSDLEITFTVPPEENFTDPQARYRGVVCYLYDPGGRPLSGSARGTRR